MPVKKSVRLTDDTIKTLHELTLSGSVNWSGSINDLSARYNILIADNMPELSVNERNAFYCVFNGYMPNPDLQTELNMLHWHISEGYQYDAQVSEYLGSEQSALDLIERIKSWSDSEKLAVIHMARAYWRQGPISDDSNSD